ncbi:MAG: 2-succinyl-5-enolpyruvyl-6-hydroxy-3-cyclohexene-1-carboxylate synthase [Bacteroidaceae bacterium]|nr:2-succinyl-5-enolpyruvyl-6-hydroxy-3-cyclohexene-1-carboxylate synthase [Bacteroidaceae bacterium]
MNNQYYTQVRNAQIVLYLLKSKGIKKVIASPGTQNMSLVVSMQRDPFFEMYSAADERSAAYMACGLAAESGEPVVLSCTGATASRNYIPALTEAFYRHLPVIAITSTERTTAVGHDIAQVIDRASLPNDIAKISVLARTVDCDNDAWDCMIQVNKALLELNHHGKGPVHINLEKVNDTDFSCKEIPSCRVIDRFCYGDELPKLPNDKKVAIYIGSHVSFTKEVELFIDSFCAKHNSVVFCDHTSNYHGKYKILAALLGSQDWNHSFLLDYDIVIQLGEITGNYYQLGVGTHAKEVWRVNEDGKIKDTFKKLRFVFEMSESNFFSQYIEKEYGSISIDDNYKQCQDEYQKTLNLIPELPFGNIWIARFMAPKMPKNSLIHFGILNSLRSWNFFNIDESIDCYANVGGFGIDGGVSSMIGSSLANPEQLHFGIFGDLAFFYDMNVLGNRHVGNNIRILLLNNAKGSEFKLYHHPASLLGDEADMYISAAGHYGRKSPTLVRHYAEDLGFEYLSADTKESFSNTCDRFLNPNLMGRPMLFEVFTDTQNESDALKIINSLVKSKENQRKDKIKKLIGEENAHAIQRIINKIKS